MEPNTVCKNVNCTKGKDGGRKHFYACKVCAKRQAWRSLTCSVDCYIEYMDQVHAARSNGKPVDYLPDRTDMTKEELEVMINETPEEEVIAEMKRELGVSDEENIDDVIRDLLAEQSEEEASDNELSVDED